MFSLDSDKFSLVLRWSSPQATENKVEHLNRNIGVECYQIKACVPDTNNPFCTWEFWFLGNHHQDWWNILSIDGEGYQSKGHEPKSLLWTRVDEGEAKSWLHGSTYVCNGEAESGGKIWLKSSYRLRTLENGEDLKEGT